MLRPFALILLVLVGTGGWAAPTTARAQTGPTENVPVVHLGAASEPAAASRRPSREETGPRRYGVARSVRLSPKTHGAWSTEGGTAVWRLRVEARDAAALSLGFSSFRLPPGARLTVADPDGDTVRGPYTGADATGGQHWTPHVRGGALVVTLRVPARHRSAVDLAIHRVVHAARSVLPDRETAPPAGDAAQTRAGACNVDVACAAADPFRKQVRAVGLYTFVDGGVSYSCTGALVNTTRRDRTPYLLTAEHCIQEADDAASMVVYWNYRSPTCRPPGSSESGRVTPADRDDQTSTGGVLTARYGQAHRTGSIAGRPDLSLVRIDDVLPLAYGLFFAGWDARAAVPGRGAAIHHPRGDGKRVALEKDSLSADGYFGQAAGSGAGPSPATHLKVEAWETGTTETGSSGGPLFGADKRLRGVLSGGRAGCERRGDGTSVDNDEPDWFGRLAAGWSRGDYEGRTFREVLAPGTAARTLGGLSLVDSSDASPPAGVEGLTARPSDADPGKAVALAWTAPGDDGRDGTAYRYQIRYAPRSAIDPPLDGEAEFEAATPLGRVVRAGPAGTAEEVVVTGLDAARTYSFAVRAVDDGGNKGPLRSATTPDNTPPARPAGLSASVAPEQASVRLAWTAPGDDSSRGTADTYQVRRSPKPIETRADFLEATAVGDVPAPDPAGARQSLTASDLSPGRPYFFALRAVDRAGNASPIARTDSLYLPDALAPSPPAELSATLRPDRGAIALSWTAPGDDSTAGTAARYELRRAGAPIRSADAFAAARPVGRPPRPDTAGTRQSTTAYEVASGAGHYLALRAVDEAGNASAPRSTDSLFLPDGVPPGPVSDLTSRVDPSSGAVTLSWTAPGDDSTAGAAARYDVRVAPAAIDGPSDYEQARPLGPPPAPKPAGETQTMRLPSLERRTAHFFAVRAVDDAGNASALSATDSSTVSLLSPVALRPPAPHPAETQTTVRFSVQVDQTVTIDLYDAMGRHVRRVFRDRVRAFREQRVRVRTNGLASGMYFLRYRGRFESRNQELVVVR
jgi:lysyl endopeptidase